MIEVKRYRKKPVVIEAMLFDGTDESATKIMSWAAGHGVTITHSYAALEGGSEGVHSLGIPTLEGEMLAHGGAHVIKGVANEFYPCKPDIFEATYEDVAE